MLAKLAILIFLDWIELAVCSRCTGASVARIRETTSEYFSFTITTLFNFDRQHARWHCFEHENCWTNSWFLYSHRNGHSAFSTMNIIIYFISVTFDRNLCCILCTQMILKNYESSVIELYCVHHLHGFVVGFDLDLERKDPLSCGQFFLGQSFR